MNYELHIIYYVIHLVGICVFKTKLKQLDFWLHNTQFCNRRVIKFYDFILWDYNFPTNIHPKTLQLDFKKNASTVEIVIIIYCNMIPIMLCMLVSLRIYTDESSKSLMSYGKGNFSQLFHQIESDTFSMCILGSVNTKTSYDTQWLGVWVSIWIFSCYWRRNVWKSMSKMRCLPWTGNITEKLWNQWKWIEKIFET